MFDSVVDSIGNTPIIRLNRLAPAGINLYVKLESRNPGGSVKDRLAREAIEEAERSGALRPGQTVVEATSGNTGISLAMVCAAKAYPLVVVMAENFSLERRRLMRLLGARIVLTPAVYKGSGMLVKARELARHLDGYLVSQFDNEANARAHERTTAEEILTAFGDRPLDYFVTGAGTGGTLKGVASRLRTASPSTRIVVCEPDNSPVLASGRPQPGDGSSHPDFRPHLMQGWSPDFIPSLTAAAIANGMVDRIVPVAGDAALQAAHALARKEGILAGITAGATLAGALQVSAQAEPGSSILVMLPDSAERYLSTALFEGIADDMDEAEWALSRATPHARFDQPPPIAAAVPSAPATVDAETAAELESLLADADNPVLMFALTWCEFCGSLRKLFRQSGIPYRAIDLDAPSMQLQDRGGRLRRALQAKTGMPSIPQVFVGGRFVGGCGETLEAHQDGTLADLLERAGLTGIVLEAVDPATILPQWRQPGRKA